MDAYVTKQPKLQKLPYPRKPKREVDFAYDENEETSCDSDILESEMLKDSTGKKLEKWLVRLAGGGEGDGNVFDTAIYENGYIIENPLNPVTQKPYTPSQKLALIMSLNPDGPCVFRKAKGKQKRLNNKKVLTHRVMALFRRIFYSKNKHLNPDAGTPDEEDPRVTWSLDASHLCGNGDGEYVCIRLAHVVLESRHENNARIDCHSFGKTHCLTPIDPGWFALAGHRCVHNPPCV